MRKNALVWLTAAFIGLVVGSSIAGQQQTNPRQQPGAAISMFAPEQHDLYDGVYVLSANRIYMIGGLNDPVGWDHVDNEAKTVKPVTGTAEIDVNGRRLLCTSRGGVRARDPERQTAVRQLRDALHDHTGLPRPEDAARELPDGG